MKKIPPYAVSYFRAPGEPGYRSSVAAPRRAAKPFKIALSEEASKAVAVTLAAVAFSVIFISFFFFAISLAPKPLVPGTYYDQELPDGSTVKVHFLGSLKDTASLPGDPALGDEWQIGSALWVYALPINGKTALWVDP
jgi:hypothetical protein